MSSVTYPGWRSNKFSSDESYDSGGQTHNLVFLDTNTLESQRLFETNAYVIVQTDKYSQKWPYPEKVDIPEESINEANVQMTKKPHQKFTNDQKAEAVFIVEQSGKSVNQVAKEENI
jgi:hypothetical protein